MPSATATIATPPPAALPVNVIDALLHNFVQCRDMVAVEYAHATIEGRVDSLTYGELSNKVFKVVNYITFSGFAPADRLAVWSGLRPEALFADLGAVVAGGISTSIAATATIDDVVTVVADLAVRYLFVENEHQVDALKARRKDLPTVQHVFVFDIEQMDTPDDDWCVSFAWMMTRPTQVLNIGIVHDLRRDTPPDALFSVHYPDYRKRCGVALTHATLLTAAEGLAERLPTQPTDTAPALVQQYFVRTTLDDYYTRLFTYLTLIWAKKLILTPPNTALRTLLRDTAPAWMPVRADELTALRTDIETYTADGSLNRFALRAAMRAVELEQTETPLPTLLKLQLRFYKGRLQRISRTFQHKIQFWMTYGAPLPADTARFFHGLGWTVLQSFGTTESGGFATLVPFGTPKPTSVGTPLKGVTIDVAHSRAVRIRPPYTVATPYPANKQPHKSPPDDFIETDYKGWLTGEWLFVDAE